MSIVAPVALRTLDSRSSHGLRRVRRQIQQRTQPIKLDVVVYL